jgi:hypothetical protein
MTPLNKYMVPLIAILACAGLLGTILVGREIYRTFNPYLDREVAGPVTLSSQWLEIVPKEPLRRERKNQYIVLQIAEHLTTANPALEPTLEDGSIVTFEVELIDQNGNPHVLSVPAGDGRTEVWRGMEIEESRRLADNIAFRTVRLRSNKPIRCSSILWRVYDPRDLK